MNSRERILSAFRFEKTDRLPCDLMENKLPDQLREYYRTSRGISDEELMLRDLGCDCRWINIGTYPFFTDIVGNRINTEAVREDSASLADLTVSDAAFHRPLADARLSDIEAITIPDFDETGLPNFPAAREAWPSHAVILSSSAPPLFMSACEVFGLEKALMHMIAEPRVFGALIDKVHRHNMTVLSAELGRARGNVDICRLWDDVASQETMLFDPALWRAHIKPRLAEEIALIRDHGLLSLYHECGNIRPILPDLIEIGVNGVEVFQTTASEMDVLSITRDFGGKIAFYGGIDVQTLLTRGTTEEVRSTVRSNARAFAGRGGYIAANSHNGTTDIRNENIIAMFDESQQCR